MFNFKKIATAALIATSIMCVGDAVKPQAANAGTCWELPAGARRVQGYYCQTTRRVNANGHVVWDLTSNSGTTTLVFWDDNVVEIIGLTARPVQTTYYTDRDGDYRIELPGGAELAIRL